MAGSPPAVDAAAKAKVADTPSGTTGACLPACSVWHTFERHRPGLPEAQMKGPAKKAGGYSQINLSEDDGGGGLTEAPASPEFRSSFFSWDNFVFAWMTPLVKQGSIEPLQLEHLFALSPQDKASSIAARFAGFWVAELSERPAAPSLRRAMYHTFGKRWLKAGLFKLCHDFMAFGGPFFLGLLLEFLVRAQTQETNTAEGVGYALGLFSCAQIQSICLHQYFHRVFRVGMHARVSVITAVYRKSLRLSLGAKQGDTVGQMVNLMAVDARRLNDLLPYLHNIWSSPLQIVISMFMLWQQIGPAVLAGLTVMLVVMPLNAYMARIQQRMQRNLMGARDERVKVFNEVVNGRCTGPVCAHRNCPHPPHLLPARPPACLTPRCGINLPGRPVLPCQGSRSSRCTPGRRASRTRSRRRARRSWRCCAGTVSFVSRRR